MTHKQSRRTQRALERDLFGPEPAPLRRSRRKAAPAITARPVVVATRYPEAEQVKRLAIGRLFRLCSRPSQPEDIDQYERLRAAFTEAVESPETFTLD